MARLWFKGNAGHPGAGKGCMIRPYREFDRGSFGPDPAALKRRRVDYKETYPERLAAWKIKKATLTQLAAVMLMFEEAVEAANTAAAEQAALDEVDADLIDLTVSNVSEETFKRIHALGLDHLQTEVIPHVYRNTAQNRFGQCRWTSFHQWVKPAVIMMDGNEEACKYLALRISSQNGFKKDDAYLQRKHKVSLDQYEQLENGLQCKKRKKKAQDSDSDT